MRNLADDLTAEKTILSIVGNNDTEGTGTEVDLQGCEGALVIFNIGASGDTLSGSVYVTLTVMECATSGGTFTAVADADLGGGANSIVIDAAAEDDVVHWRAYFGSLRYIKAFVDFTGTHTNGIPISAVVVKGKRRHATTS